MGAGPATAVRFLVVEDDPAVCRALKQALGRHGAVVVVGTAREAKKALRGTRNWTGLFVDIGLPDGSGIDVLRAARKSHPLTRAMVLTGQVQAAAINETHDLDADYVVKPVALARIDRFCREATSMPERFDTAVRVWTERYRLSVAQSDVLARSVAGEDRAEIAAARGIVEVTVKKHVANLLQLTGDESLQAAVARFLREIVRSG